MFTRFSKKAIVGVFCSALLLISTKLEVKAQSSDTATSDVVNQFTLMPMFLPDGNSYGWEDLLPTMIKDQGYEAHCAAMQWAIDKKLLGDINKFFSDSIPPEESFYNGLNPTVFSGIAPYVTDLSKARIPMFRGLENKEETIKNSSLEGMFGANYQTLHDSYMLNSAGVSKRVLSSYQQCLAKAQNLLAAKQICDEVTDECTIDKKYEFKIAVDEEGSSRVVTDAEIKDLKSTEHVVDVNFNLVELLDWFQAIRPELADDQLYQQVCLDITGGDSSVSNTSYAPPDVDLDQIAKLREGVNRIGIDFDTLYRLAFLVLVPTQDPGKYDEGDKFYFLQADPQVDSQVEAPTFIAFKIPDFGTNKSRIAGNIDTLELTKMVIQPKEQNDKDLKDQADKRELLYQSALAPTKPVIGCPYPKCLKPLERTLISIINGTSITCRNDTLRVIENTSTETGEEIDMSSFNLNLNERQATASGIEFVFNQEDLNWERAGDLFTPAAKEMKEYSYREQMNKAIVDELYSLHVNDFEWKLVIDEDPPPLDPPMIVNAYLVLPIGENVKDVNKALSIFWNEEDFFELVRTNIIEDMTNDDGTSKQGAIPKYYTIKDVNFGISAADEIHPLDECTEVENEDGEIVEECTKYAFGFGFSDTASKEESSSKGELLIPDFGLGFMVRKIQQKLRNTFSQTYDYIVSCQRVEDMFLGRCSGDPEGKQDQSFCKGEAFKNVTGLPPTSGIPQYAKDMFTADIAPKITDELIEAYEYAEEETGIPCEVVAGIHWTEAGLDPNGSVWDGNALRGGSLKEDAKTAMEHLLSFWPGSFNKENIPYEDLTEAIGAYNGPGNMNCSTDKEGELRDTRWRDGGKCEAQFTAEDHPHPLGWIDERHSDMDLIYCLDYVEFNCTSEPTDFAMQELRKSLDQSQAEYGFDDAYKEQLLTDAASYCYAGSNMCQSLSNGNKYPEYNRPGSITTAILLNESGAAAQ